MLPLVTVAIPTFNDIAYIGTAVDSILSQTYQNLEIFFLIEHGTNDGTAEFVKALRDPRVRWLENRERLGLPASLNILLREASGTYLARMDTDDIAHPTRIARQVEFMEGRPEVAICGTFCQLFGDENWRFIPAVDHQAIHMELLLGCTFVHPSVIFRRAAMLDAGLWYDEALAGTEDYDLWARASQVVKLANVPEILLDYRKHAKSKTLSNQANGINIYKNIMGRQLEELLGGADPREVNLHHKIFTGGLAEQAELLAVRHWFEKLVTANDERGTYEPRAFRRMMGDRFFDFCTRFDTAFAYAVLRSSALDATVGSESRAAYRERIARRLAETRRGRLTA